MVNIIGGGLAGCVVASQVKAKIYERDEVGGLCVDNAKYQKYVHIFHTSDEDIWQFVERYAKIRPYKHYVKSWVEGNLLPWVPPTITPKVREKQMDGYSLKMWRQEAPPEAIERVKPKCGDFFGEMSGIINFRRLFANLLGDTAVIKRDIKDGDLSGDIILTGAIDEYFHYCYGKLPYRGMKSCHCESEQGLEVAQINFPNDFPFIRMIDYQRLGYQNYIGIEFPSDDKHYPVQSEESQNLYLKYKELADKKGVKLIGRLATYKYMDMDETIGQALTL